MTNETTTRIETIAPAFKVGDSVTLRDGRTGVIASIYRNSGIPLWYGSRRVIHTHCYEIKLDMGTTWGWVDAELTAA